MRSKWIISLFAAGPMIAAILAIQSCGGVGGPAGAAGGGDTVSEAFLGLLSAEQRTATAVGADRCADCHGGRADGDSVHASWSETAHAAKGVSCESCHGNGSVHAAAPSKDNILTLPKAASPVVCGQCHGPINDQFEASAHFQIIQSPVQGATTNPANNGRNSRCVMCHGGLFRTETSDAGVDIGTLTDAQIVQIANDTLTHVPHSATCNTCHDPHRQTGNLNAEGEEVQLRSKTFNTDVSTIGPANTTAASFTNYDHSCAKCHNGRGVNPADSALNSGTSRPNMHDSNQYQMLLGLGGVEDSNDGPVVRNTAHAQAPGQCSKCHMPDARHTFTVSYDKGCSPCHTAADAAARVSSTKTEVIDELVALRTRMENFMLNNANPALRDADFWDYTSLIAAEGKTAPNQTLIPIEVKRARHNYYFVVRSGDYGVHNAPYAKYLIFIANQQMGRIDGRTAASTRAANPYAGMTTDQKLAVLENDRRRAREADIAEGGEH